MSKLNNGVEYDVHSQLTTFLEEGFALKIIEGDEFEALKLAKVAVLVLDNPGLTASEVANHLNISYKSANRYLEKAHVFGILEIKIEGKDGKYRYYPSPEKKEYIEVARSLLERLEKWKSCLQSD